MENESLIATYGYVVLLAGTMMEGETFLVAAAVLAQQGYLDLRWVILTAFCGGFIADQCCFFLGRTRGVAFLAKRRRWQRKSQRVFCLMRRFDIILILGLHFLYGLRSVIPFIIGSSGFSAPKFFILNGLGVLAWAALIGCLGYQFGYLLVAFLQEAKKYQIFFLCVFAVMAVAFWIIRQVVRRRERTSSPECPPLP
jgi:membrane protein DedA with SNARE-associated domain